MLKYLTENQVNKIKEFGKEIKSRREELSISISKASDIIRINASELRIIEQGDYKNYPNVVFLRGFIRNYCKLLDLDSSKMIRIINEIYNANSNENNSINKTDDSSKNTNSFKYKIFILLIILLLFVVGSYFVFNIFFKGENNEPISVFSEEIEQINNSISGDNYIEEKEIIPPIVEPTPVFVNLELNAKENGWIRLKIDDQDSENIRVNLGDTYKWQGEKKINITLSRGDLADLKINNRDHLISPTNFNRLYQKTFVNFE